MEQVLGDKSDNTMDHIIQEHRGAKIPKSKRGCKFTEGNVEHLDGLLNNDDTKEVVVAAKKEALATKIRESKFAAMKGSKRMPRTLTVDIAQECLPKEEAATLIPTCIGSTINKNKSLHFRWKASRPCDVAPFTYSAAWNKERIDEEAFKLCVEWLWEQHTKKTAEPCPWDLNSFEFVRF